MNATPDLFWAYFNVADELSPPVGWYHVVVEPLTIDDLEAADVADARDAANRCGLPWPPQLAAAEEYALAHYGVGQ